MSHDGYRTLHHHLFLRLPAHPSLLFAVGYAPGIFPGQH